MDLDNLTGKKFTFDMVAEPLTKAESPDGQRWVRMLASTDSRDLEGERLMQKGGMDFDYLLSYGHFTDEHDQRIRDAEGNITHIRPAAVIGEPREAQFVPPGVFCPGWGLMIKGILYEGLERADYWYDTLVAMKKSGAQRRVGASVDGKTVERDQLDKSTVLKSWLRNVAFTHHPVNPDTFVELMKALTASWHLDPRQAAQRVEYAPGASAQQMTIFKGGVVQPGHAIQQYDGGSGVLTEEQAVRYLCETQNYSPFVARSAVREIMSVLN